MVAPAVATPDIVIPPVLCTTVEEIRIFPKDACRRLWVAPPRQLERKVVVNTVENLAGCIFMLAEADDHSPPTTGITSDLEQTRR